MGYCTEEQVYEATGLNSTLVQNLSGKSSAEVTTLITSYISQADKRIQRFLKSPITIRKESHNFDEHLTIELGPYEDEHGFFNSYKPANCVEEVFVVYDPNGRIKLPYPKNCDDLTEDITSISGTNVTLTKETTIKKCGTASIKAVFSGAGNFKFPSTLNLDKNINPWDFIGFWLRTTNKTATFTIKLFDKDGNYKSHTFSCTLNDTWQIIGLEMDSFTDSGGDIGWDETMLQYIQIESDKACTIYFDNFCFNSGVFWTAPEGLICWSDPDDISPSVDVEVTYSYDPFKVTTPVDIQEASAKLAGVLLLDYCIGHRQRIEAFNQMAQDADRTPDKETLEVTRGRIKREAEEAINGFGYGTYR
jgi:hypothetical protein